MAKTIISLANISKNFGTHTALRSINLNIQDGEFLTLLGPSGCGKTTLLRLISGFESPDEGAVLLNNIDITTLAPEARRINLVFQSYALFPHMTVYQNVAFGLQCEKKPAAEIEAKVIDVLQRVKLLDFRDRKPMQLSGGQQQRVAIARALVKQPLVLLLDEPLSALDYSLRKEMRMELKALQRRLGITFILVTHDQEEALTLSDRIVVMNQGKIEQMGRPRDVYENPCNLFVAEFIGEANIFRTCVIAANKEMLAIEIGNKRFLLKNTQQFAAGDFVNVVIRPEDIAAWDKNELDHPEDFIAGKVENVIYKGSTVDLKIQLCDGKMISVTEFFDEDDEKLEYEIGQFVYLHWTSGWEVVLPDEK